MHLSQLLPLTYLLHTTTTFLDSSSFVIVLALSFFKAFDSVRHSAVLEKYSRLNIPDNIYSWIESFLQDYSHITEFDNDVSARNVDRMAGMSCAALSSVSLVVSVLLCLVELWWPWQRDCSLDLTSHQSSTSSNIMNSTRLPAVMVISLNCQVLICWQLT